MPVSIRNFANTNSAFGNFINHMFNDLNHRRNPIDRQEFMVLLEKHARTDLL